MIALNIYSPSVKEDAAFEVISLAIQVFGEEKRAQSWLSLHHHDLDGKTPRQMLRTKAGRERVSEILNAIRYGVF